MRRIALVFSLFTLSACAGSYKASYVAGAVTKQFTTDAYDIYSEQFNKKLDECDPQNNSAVTTKEQLDDCMGDAFKKETHDKIELAAKAYYEAAKVYSEIMMFTDGDAESRKESTRKVLESSMNLLSLFPDGEKLVNKLKGLTGAK